VSSDIEVMGQRSVRPTMRDVATLAGVAIKTVSRVMNDVPTVDPELAARVLGASEKLGYRRNLTASNLRRSDGRTHTIGLLLDDVGNPYAARIHRAIEDSARERNFVLLAGSLDEDPVRERTLARALIDRRVDGLIIMPAGDDHRYVVAEQLAGTSFVFIDREPVPLVADAVTAHNRRGSKQGVEHLIERGHRRIAYFGDSQSIFTARRRFTGYHEAVTEAGLEVEPTLVFHDLASADEAREAATRLLASANRPDAIFASQNLVTIGIVEALHRLQLQEQVAFVGFDDVPFGALIRPGLTVVAQDPAAIGKLAAERLFARIDGDQSPPYSYSIPTQIVQRGSGELAPRGAS
jgi:LacI family transcriptional regulator